MFKVGDKVVVVDPSGCVGYVKGETCVVEKTEYDYGHNLIFCIGKCGGMYDFRFKLAEEPKFDIKTIVKPFMRVKTRNDHMFIAVDSGADQQGMVLVDPHGDNSWNRIRNDAEGTDSGFDIVSVYDAPRYVGDYLSVKKFGSLVWSAKTPKELKIEALEKELAELKASK